LAKEMISNAVPIVIAESAILKTGHILTSIKSITYSNLTLSIRLPKAPDIIRISPKLKRKLDENLPRLIAFIRILAIMITATMETSIKKYALFLKSPKAAPVFFINVICRTFCTIGMDWPRDSFEEIIALET